MFEKLELKTAVWVYDIDQHRIVWANNAALGWWESPSLNELSARDLSQGASQAVSQTMNEYQKNFLQGKSFTELWHFTPNGISKRALCRFSGAVLDDGRMGMLVEATSSDTFSKFSREQNTTIVATFSKNGKFESGNPPFLNAFGGSRVNLDNLLSDMTQLITVQQNLAQHNHYEIDVLLKTKRGKTWFRASFTSASRVVKNKSEKMFLCHLHNIDNRKKRELVLIQQAYTDALTGLLNRRGFSQALSQSLASNIEITFFYIDLDGFKMINDALGHAVGDMVLQEVAKRLTSIKLNDAQYCRFGGDEFLIAIPTTQNKKSISQISSLLLQKLSQPYTDEGYHLNLISSSIGIATSPKDGNSLDELIRFADSAMYHSKQHGKKRATVFVAGMEKQILRKSKITQYLSTAIQNNELYLHYQPIINTHKNTIHSFEALLRWKNPELGQVPPNELIAVAEHVGLIEEVENWVARRAIADLPLLRKYTNSQATLAINISSIHLANPELPDFLINTLQNNGLLPSDLGIEITESVELDDVEKANRLINQITSLGINVSIDDFGTGYSSLAYLYKINASIIKIDREFVNITSNPKTALKSVHNLITSIGRMAVVEGIETEEDADTANEAGIILHQGYLYARPKPLSAFEQDDKADVTSP